MSPVTPWLAITAADLERWGVIPGEAVSIHVLYANGLVTIFVNGIRVEERAKEGV